MCVLKNIAVIFYNCVVCVCVCVCVCVYVVLFILILVLFIQVFTDLQEELLEQYVTKVSDIYYGLSPKKVRKQAYQYGKANSIKMPHNWSANESAGEDSFSTCLKRHKKLSIRKP